MEKRFVYAGNEQSISKVLSTIGEGGDQEAPRTLVRNFSGHNETLELFEIAFSSAESLDDSARSGSDPLSFRFFRQRRASELPTEFKIKKNNPGKIIAMNRAIKAARKKRSA